MEIWTLIVKSNTFNFTIFLLIIIAIAKHVDIDGIISSMQRKVQKLIDDAKAAKEASINELKRAEDSVKNVGIEVKSMLDNAESGAERLGEKIMDDAKKQVDSIEKNIEKVVESEGKKIISKLSKNASLASVELAKKHIQTTLRDKPHYHADFINDSINELDRLNF